METITRRSHAKWILITALAPISWGANYYVINHFLPADIPLWGAALRALPAGLILFALARKLPSGSWWWRAPVLGMLNFCGFFVLIFLAAQMLPSSIAASLMALAPFVFALLGAALLHQRLGAWTLAGATSGLIGVLLIVGLSAGTINGWGVAASVAALLSSALGSVLTERWRDESPVIAVTAWQLLAAGAVLTALAFVFEGPPPQLETGGIAAIAFLSMISTALAFVCWFSGLAHLPSGVVGIVGLLNPVTGVLLGTILANESLTPAQVLGIALVLVGILLGQRDRRPATITKPSEVAG